MWKTSIIPIDGRLTFEFPIERRKLDNAKRFDRYANRRKIFIKTYNSRELLRINWNKGNESSLSLNNKREIQTHFIYIETDDIELGGCWYNGWWDTIASNYESSPVKLMPGTQALSPTWELECWANYEGWPRSQAAIFKLPRSV